MTVKGREGDLDCCVEKKCVNGLVRPTHICRKLWGLDTREGRGKRPKIKFERMGAKGWAKGSRRGKVSTIMRNNRQITTKAKDMPNPIREGKRRTAKRKTIRADEKKQRTHSRSESEHRWRLERPRKRFTKIHGEQEIKNADTKGIKIKKKETHVQLHNNQVRGRHKRLNEEFIKQKA